MLIFSDCSLTNQGGKENMAEEKKVFQVIAPDGELKKWELKVEQQELKPKNKIQRVDFGDSVFRFGSKIGKVVADIILRPFLFFAAFVGKMREKRRIAKEAKIVRLEKKKELRQDSSLIAFLKGPVDQPKGILIIILAVIITGLISGGVIIIWEQREDALHQQRMTAIEEQHQQKMTAIEEQHQQKMTAIEEQHQQKITAIKEKGRQRIMEQIELLKQKIQQSIEEQHRKELELEKTNAYYRRPVSGPTYEGYSLSSFYEGDSEVGVGIVGVYDDLVINRIKVDITFSSLFEIKGNIDCWLSKGSKKVLIYSGSDLLSFTFSLNRWRSEFNNESSMGVWELELKGKDIRDSVISWSLTIESVPDGIKTRL